MKPNISELRLYCVILIQTAFDRLHVKENKLIYTNGKFN